MAVAIVTAGLASPASAQQLPEDNSGTGQYIEPVPDAGGDRPANPGAGGGSGSGSGGGSGPGGLPPSVREALPPGEDGRILERLVTDPGSGAPAGAGAGSNGGGPDRGGSAGEGPAAGDTAQESSAAGALGSAATGDDGPAIPLLAAALLLLTLGAAGIRLRAGRS